MTSLEELKEFLKDFFQGEDVEIYLFGSRARGENSEFSDIDIAILSRQDISDKLVVLRYILEESNLPFKVDIVDLNKARYLKEVIKKEGVRWL